MARGKPLGVGLIGSGFMGKCHAIAWSTVGPVFGGDRPVKLVTLAEVDAKLAEKRGREFGFAKSTGNWRDLLADPDIEVISITVPNQFHAEMAIAALEAGKHLWCEKPMAPELVNAEKMLAAQKKAKRVCAVGYNYVQNPAIRHIRKLLDEGVIGQLSHVRLEMDEDFMADPDALFFWKHEASSGYGALDDFAVHPLSLMLKTVGLPAKVFCDMAMPFPDRPVGSGGRRKVETYDVTTTLFRLSNGVSGSLAANRAAWGRKGRIAFQIYGAKGSLVFDQERMNELQLFTTGGRASEHGFRTILSAPIHQPYDRFLPAPGHGLGFNDLKTIECHELLAAIAGRKSHSVSFEDGVRIERTVHAMAASFKAGRWTDVPA